MTRRAARITHDEVKRIIKAVQACGLPIARVTFDGERVDVVVAGEGNSHTLAARDDPATFRTLAEYKSWRAMQGESGYD